MTIVQTQKDLLQEVNGLLDSDNIKKNSLDAGRVIEAGSITSNEIKNYGMVVSSLPSSPVDGDICFFQSSAMATDGIVWQLRYRLGGGTYKWEFVGGPPLFAEVTTSESTTSTSYVNLTTTGPAVALPLAGDFDVELAARTDRSTTLSEYMSYAIGGTAAVDADSALVSGTTNYWSTTYRMRRKTGLTAVTLTAKYRTTAGTATFVDRAMTVTPVRVG